MPCFSDEQSELLLAQKDIEHFVESYCQHFKSQLTSIEGLVSITIHLSPSPETIHCLQLIHQCLENLFEIIRSLELSVSIPEKKIDECAHRTSGVCQVEIQTDIFPKMVDLRVTANELSSLYRNNRGL